MDFYHTQGNYILGKDKQSLWCNRINGNLKLRPASSISDLQFEVKCSGKVYGVVGKVQFLPGSDFKLVLITKRSKVANLPDGSCVYRIDKIAVIPLSAEECPEIDFDLCKEHKDHVTVWQTARDGQPKVTQTFNNFKTSLANQFKASNKTNFQKAMEKEIRDKEKLDKLEKRLQEEFVKIFNDSESFFYSENGDLTNTLQRNEDKNEESKTLPVWKTADERFFWNKAMLKEIITLTESDQNANKWIIPIIQGYVEQANCEVDFSDVELHKLMQIDPELFDLTLISRRSVTRAGTRYKRRGVDEDGNVANYVETEQIVRAGRHSLSFVQVRGSIPIYWSQAGIKYRPPAKLERTKEESQEAMKKHFAKELEFYKKLVVINLVDQAGREQILSDALMEHIITLNNHSLTYVTFDFHDYCRGMKFENVSVLVESLAEITEDIRYCWVDSRGMICAQRGVFRVNCMDCLDRTNVVQMSLARDVMKSQLRKLGRLMPEQSLPPDVRETYQHMWANNGDAISRQYAGTAAMKGDFTRTGERRFTGVMKDGYHSANRYLNRFTAAYRQTVIDIMLGIPPSEDISLLIAAMKQPEDPEEEWTMQREEWVAQLVNHCQQLLVDESEVYLGGWALIEPRISSEGEVDPDFEQEVVLLLTDQTFYVSRYEEEDEYVNQYEKESLKDLEKIEIGPDSSLKTRHSYLRLHYRSERESGYFRTFQTVQSRTPAEGQAVLRGIADEFHKACDAMNLNPKITECRLNKKKSKRHNIIQILTTSRPFRTDITRNNKNISPDEPDKLEPALPVSFYSDVSSPQDDSTIFDSCRTAVGTAAPDLDNRLDRSSDAVEFSGDAREDGCEDIDVNTRKGTRKATNRDTCEDDNEVICENSSIGAGEGTREGARNDTREDAREDILGNTRKGTREDARNDDVLTNPVECSREPSEKTSDKIANFKKMVKNRFDDVSVKFQRNKGCATTTEIVWQNEEGSGDEAPRITGRRNIFTAAQERGRTIIPDLKNKFSGLSNRGSPKLERKKDWVQVIKHSNCKTRIMQL